MNLPHVIAELVTAQNHSNSVAYANYFSNTAQVKDKGKTYQGKAEIQQWITQANEKYKIIMQPIAFTQTGSIGVLIAEISGTFPGNPAVLNYHVELKDDLIQSLKILS